MSVLLLIYHQATESLGLSATQSLVLGAELKARFINNWFEYRLIDLAIQAKSQHTVNLLMQLSEELKRSGKTPKAFVRSASWALQVDAQKNEFLDLLSTYDYLYDLFLIDNAGNILFSVLQESDLGTNLFDGELAKTRFAQAVKSSLKMRKTVFSDIEYYRPSDDLLSGFLSTPVLDKQGKKIGLFVMQIKVNRLIELLGKKKHSQESMVHYLVGEDGLLRTQAYTIKNNKPLLTRIDSEQFRLWKTRGYQDSQTNDLVKNAFSYRGPSDERVLGLYQTIMLPGIKWVLISEVDEKETFALIYRVTEITIGLVIMVALVVIFLAFLQARKIIQPLAQLVDASWLVAAGDLNQKVDIDADNEIGRLADAFNKMVAMRQCSEAALKASARETQQALDDLAEQKFAPLVLIVDDQPVNLQLLGGVLQKKNYRLVFATNGEAALNALQKVNPDLILLDVMMPEMDGYEVCQKIKQDTRTQNIPIIFLTAKIGEEDIVKGFELGAFDYVTKPFNVKELTTRVETQIKLKVANDALAQKVEELAILNARKDRFFSIIAHDLKNPFGGTMSLCDYILNHDLENSEIIKLVNAIRQSSKMGFKLLENLLEWSRSQTGKISHQSDTFRMDKIIDTVFQLYSSSLKKKNIQFVSNITEDIYVLADINMVDTILRNLVSNAIKFTPQNGKIVIAASIKNDIVEMSVTDNGIGINQQDIDKLFKLDSKLTRLGLNKERGTGLGLILCKEFVEKNHGQIWVNSEEGKGTTFSFTLKMTTENVSSEEKAPTKPHALPVLSAAKALSDICILVVDDQPINHYVITGVLANMGYVAECVDSGKKACEVMLTKDYHLVFMDLQMPDMDGITTTKRIRQAEQATHKKRTPIIALTADELDEIRQDCLEAGMDDCVSKPLPVEDIRQMINRFVIGRD